MVVEDVPKRKEGDSTVNPANYFRKLVDSHGFSEDVEAVEFFKGLVTDSDEFFSAKNMPSSWSLRTYAVAAHALADIVSNNETKKLLGEADIDVDGLIEELTKKKRHFLSVYKKEKRKAAKTLIVEPSGMEAEAGDSPHQIILSEDALPLSPPSESSILSAMCDNDDLVSIHRVKSRISHAVSMLDKYMKHETDEFKVVFLDVIKDTLMRVVSDADA